MVNVNIVVTDAELIKSYLEGKELALSKLIERHQSKIHGFIYSKVLDKDIANDIFQDTFIKVIKTLKKKTYNEEGKFLSWVMRIAYNLVIDYFRENKKMPMNRETEGFSVFSVMADYSPNIESKIISAQVEKDLQRLVEKLPKDQKEILVMRLFKDMSFKEISEIKGISINTALGRMRYAIMNLRKIIGKHNVVLVN